MFHPDEIAGRAGLTHIGTSWSWQKKRKRSENTTASHWRAQRALGKRKRTDRNGKWMRKENPTRKTTISCKRFRYHNLVIADLFCFWRIFATDSLWPHSLGPIVCARWRFSGKCRCCFRRISARMERWIWVDWGEKGPQRERERESGTGTSHITWNKRYMHPFISKIKNGKYWKKLCFSISSVCPCPCLYLGVCVGVQNGQNNSPEKTKSPPSDMGILRGRIWSYSIY